MQRMHTIMGLLNVNADLLRTDKVPGPADVRALVDGMQQRLAGADQRVGRLLERAAAREFVIDVQLGLGQHAMARGIKLMNGLLG